MKTLLSYKSLIKVAVIMVVIAFMTLQVTDTYAKKMKLKNHDADIKADIVTHDENMTTGHGDLSAEHGKLDTKLDQILEGGGGKCPDCPDAWSKVIPNANDRFELVMPTAENPGGEAVLDKETCLVWEQSPHTTSMAYTSATFHCYTREVGGRKGWHLPTTEQLATLVDSTQLNPSLPSGYDNFFSNVQSSFYWAATTRVDSAPFAWVVSFGDGSMAKEHKTSANLNYVWCVRGGQTHNGMNY